MEDGTKDDEEDKEEDEDEEGLEVAEEDVEVRMTEAIADETAGGRGAGPLVDGPPTDGPPGESRPELMMLRRELTLLPVWATMELATWGPKRAERMEEASERNWRGTNWSPLLSPSVLGSG